MKLTPGCGVSIGRGRSVLSLALLVVFLQIGAHVVAGLELNTAATPKKYAGAPFFLPSVGKPPLVNPEAVLGDVPVQVAKLKQSIPNVGPDGQEVSPHECDLGEHADREMCLTRPGRGCMWTNLMGVASGTTVLQSFSYCLPCELDGQEMPCWNPGAWISGLQVQDCQMSCPHQTRFWQPGYACTDTTGTITKMECFERGAQSDSKCMFMTLEDGAGGSKTACAPCQLEGSGTWACPATSEDGLNVASCESQCDAPCSGPDCPLSMQNPMEAMNPGVKEASAPADMMLTVPVPFMSQTVGTSAGGGVPTAAAATQEEAKARNALMQPVVQRASYVPVLLYRSPLDWAAFRTPPPPPALPTWPEQHDDGDVRLQGANKHLTRQLRVQRAP